MANDKCITCGKETPYHLDVNIEYRSHYVEGVGQLCKECWDGTYEMAANQKVYLIPESMIKETPNDSELGNKVRSMYHKHLKS